MPPDRSTDPPANSQNLGRRANANPHPIPNHLTHLHPARYHHLPLSYPSSGPAPQLEWIALSLYSRMLYFLMPAPT